MHKRYALNGVAILGLALGGAAYADDAPGFYAGASIGQASVEIDDAGFDDSDTAFKILGGYSFNQHFALEAAYFDGGSPEENFGGGSVQVDIDGFNVSAVGRLPIGEAFSVFAKLGFASYDVSIEGRVGGQVVASADGSDEDVSYGLGGEYRFGQFGLRAEYEALDLSDADFNMLSISGVYRF